MARTVESGARRRRVQRAGMALGAALAVGSVSAQAAALTWWAKSVRPFAGPRSDGRGRETLMGAPAE